MNGWVVPRRTKPLEEPAPFELGAQGAIGAREAQSDALLFEFVGHRHARDDEHEHGDLGQEL
jgi:hypothetical protein